MTKNLIISAVCLVVIGILVAYIFRPVPKPEIIGDMTPEQENELRAELVTLERQNDSLWTALEKSKAEGLEAATVFKTEIGGLRKQIAKGKANPVIIEIVKDNPSLDSLHKAYESAIVAYENRIISLTNELQVRDKINAQLQANFEQRLTATEQLLIDKEAEVMELQGQNRKLRIKLFWTKAVGIVILGGIGALAVTN